jgi:hypothetical protein
MSPIAKTINYCWFGGSPLGDKELACIESWRKFLPGYEIVRWDESNWDVRCCDYVSEAYDVGKWAFVSDYARFDILYRHGGLYFDTDVELIRPIDDILERGPFMGFETDWSDYADGTVAPGLGLAANPGLGLYRAILDSYRDDHFVKSDGSLDETTIVTRTTSVLLERGLERRPGIQEVDGVWLYPSEYFNPKDFLTGEVHVTENTRSIHHFSMSWYTPLEKERYEAMSRMLKRGMGRRRAEVLSKLVATVKMRDATYLTDKLRKIAGRR